jgi:D-alanine-D-alanine ligase
MNNDKLNVALLVGGTSPERQVSKASSKSIYKALTELGYNVKVFDPGLGVNQLTNIDDYFVENEIGDLKDENYIKLVASPLIDDIDVVFIGLHGKWGEDGALQSLLELRGIKYTGSSILASAIAMDKIYSKIMFRHFGVLTPNWIDLENGSYDLTTIKTEIKNQIFYPCIVKPNDSGSTIGLSKCKDESEIESAIIEAFKYSSKILIEEFIPGRELTVAVIDNKTYPVLEIIPHSGFYDYESKYTPGMTDYIVPADISDELSEHLQKQALLAFKALGCKTYSRVDFRVNEKKEAYVLEVNNLPGMTSTSLVPKMAKCEGLSFNELIDIILKDAIK